MKPKLFAEAATEFNTNGIGTLSDAISCTVTEERNGMFELELVYPSTGQHYEDIKNRAIIAVIPCKDASIQPFRIYQISRPIGGRVTINARHIGYDLAKNTAMPFSIQASSTACNDTLQALKANAVETCPFTFWTDVETMSSYTQLIPSTIRQRLGGIEGSVLDQFGGEYEWDKFTVKLHSHRGSDLGVKLRYGTNITDLTQDEIIAETVTGVVPYWSNMDGTQVITLPEKAVYSQYADRYSSRLTIPLDFSGQYQEAPDISTIRAAAEAYITQHNLGVPTVSVKVSFVNLADTLEYEDMRSLQSVHLCDTLTVQFEKLGIDTKAKVAAYKWNVLTEQYDEITVGSLKSSLATTLNDQNTTTVAAIDEAKAQAGIAINNATAWLSSGDGFIVAVKGENGEWKELLAMDRDDPQIAENVMKLNSQGLGGSSNGIGGPFESAILSDGTIVAARIKTGILSDGYVNPDTGLPDPKFSLNMETGALNMKDGTFSGLIKGSTLQFGRNNISFEEKYGQTNAFTGNLEYALLLEGNDRILIHSTNYQVRILGDSIHIGLNDTTDTYMDMTENYTSLFAKKNATIKGLEAAYLQGGNCYIRATNDGKIIVGNGIISGYVQGPTSEELELGTFESEGNKFLSVRKNGTSYGYVQLT